MNWPNIITIATSIVVAIPRILGNTSQSYQALAHIFIGILIGESIVSINPRRILCIILTIILSLLEITCFPLSLAR